MARIKKEERKQVLETNRHLLLQAAAVEFAREGYNGANINRISQAAGFAKGTIYNYFPSKQALMEDLLSGTAQAHYDAITVVVRMEEDPSQRLRRFFHAGFEYVAENLMASRVMVNVIYGPNLEFKVHLYQAYKPMFLFVAQEILAPGIENGIFRRVDPVTTASLLMTIYLGTASRVTDAGEFFLDAGQVADFSLNSLLREHSEA